MGVLVDFWTGELLKKFRHEGAFLSRVPGADNFVEKNAIHLADMGADPEVLVNNTAYPIEISSREDADIVISLDKFDTKNTAVTDDELYGLPYDKKGSVLNQHREVLEETTLQKSLHSLCPLEDGSYTPVLETTGESNGEANARKRLTVKDIAKMKKALDLLKVPMNQRELVLNPYHVYDLLQTDEKFAQQWYQRESGKILNMFGFNITECGYYPVFNSSTGKKAAWAAAAAAATDMPASVVFYGPRAVQAKGTAKMFYRDATVDPEYRRSVVGFRIHHICLPKKWLGFGAIASAIG